MNEIIKKMDELIQTVKDAKSSISLLEANYLLDELNGLYENIYRESEHIEVKNDIVPVELNESLQFIIRVEKDLWLEKTVGIMLNSYTADKNMALIIDGKDEAVLCLKKVKNDYSDAMAIQVRVGIISIDHPKKIYVSGID